eukprot:349731-Chlamydomonas_euryale.AAC.2
MGGTSRDMRDAGGPSKVSAPSGQVRLHATPSPRQLSWMSHRGLHTKRAAWATTTKVPKF